MRNPPGWLSPEAHAAFQAMLDAFAHMAFACTTENQADYEEHAVDFWARVRLDAIHDAITSDEATARMGKP